ncbi:MAG TPA: hypothetical protein VJS69_03605 [Candidatus Krumholzibacteria bacterium]|nr:hypothetical protein [Candidatus Krumholzibacteria bacterium]
MPRLKPARHRIRNAWVASLVLALATVSCWKVEADLSVNTTQINFATTKLTSSIVIKNDSQDNALTSGVVTLDYKLKSDQPWLTVTPLSGECGSMEKQTHTVDVDRSLMKYGQNAGTISITSNGGSAVVKVTAIREVPGCDTGPTLPVAVYPASGASNIPLSMELEWGDGDSRCSQLTATYDVYFGTTSTPPFDHNNDSLKVWNPGPLAANTTYYWRVVVKDANGEARGSLWNFQTPCDLGPGSITLIAPADNATDVSINDDLSWGGGNSQCVGLTSSYDVYFGTTSPPPFHHNTTAKYWDPGTLVKGQTYYWKIVAKDAHGTNASAVRTFTTSACTLLPTAVQLLTPLDGAIALPITQALSWAGGASQCGLANSFDVYFGTTSPPPLADNVTNKYWAPGTLQNSTRYYWKIVAKDGNGSTSSAERSFTTVASVCTLIPAAPSLTAPASGATNVPLGQALTWTAGDSRCAGQTATYDVYFGTSSTPPFDHNNGTTKTWRPTLQYDTQYYWRIVARDDNGTKSSETRVFTTPCHLPPSSVNLISPADGATGASVDSKLSWGGGNNQCSGMAPQSYDVYFGTTSSPPFLTNTTDKAWNPGPLQSGVKYYWKIIAKNANGTTSSPVRSFTTASIACTLPPSAITLAAPANQTIGVGIDNDISWTGGGSACPGLTAVYDVYFGTASSPPLAESNVAAKTWDPGRLTNGTIYYWKIVAKDDNGSTSSAVWRFQTELLSCLLPPTAPCNPTPADNANNRNRDSDLSWGCGVTLCGNAVTYDVYFGTSATLGDAQKVGSPTTKAWALPRLEGKTTYYWKVIAREANGATSSPVWSFTTKP